MLGEYRETPEYKRMLWKFEIAIYYPEDVYCGKWHNPFSDKKCKQCEEKNKQLDDKYAFLIAKDLASK